jgi:hypothetical protein
VRLLEIHKTVITTDLNRGYHWQVGDLCFACHVPGIAPIQQPLRPQAPRHIVQLPRTSPEAAGYSIAPRGTRRACQVRADDAADAAGGRVAAVAGAGGAGERLALEALRELVALEVYGPCDCRVILDKPASK